MRLWNISTTNRITSSHQNSQHLWTVNSSGKKCRLSGFELIVSLLTFRCFPPVVKKRSVNPRHFPSRSALLSPVLMHRLLRPQFKRAANELTSGESSSRGPTVTYPRLVCFSSSWKMPGEAEFSSLAQGKREKLGYATWCRLLQAIAH